MTYVYTLGAALALLCTAGWVFQRRGERADARRFPQRGSLVNLGTHRLHVVRAGPQHGPTVVIEQGAGGPCELWWPLLPRIAELAGVFAYDRAGIGYSDPAPTSRTPQQSADELHALLERARIPKPYVLVAHSYGGLIVRLLARGHLADVAGLVLVDTIEEGAHFQPEVLRLYRRFRWLLAILAGAARLGVQRLVGQLSRSEEPGVPTDTKARLDALGRTPAFFRAMRTDMATLGAHDEALREPGATGGLGDLPLVVITHGQPFPGPFAVVERHWREGQERLAALSTSGELVVAHKSNHMIQSDEPDVVVDAIRRVVDQAASHAAASRARTASPV